jgi:hypothetical protein
MKVKKILYTLTVAVAVFLFAGFFSKCDDKDVSDPPKITLDGAVSTDELVVGKEVTVNFKVSAPAKIKSVSYSLVNTAGNYEIVPVQLSSGNATELNVPVTFTAEKEIIAVKLKVIDKQNISEEISVVLGKVLGKPGILFTDNINSVDLVIIGTQYEISGIIAADADLTEVNYRAVINGTPSAPVAISIPTTGDKQNVSFTAFVDIVGGLQKVEFYAKDAKGSEVNVPFTISKIKNIALTIDPSSSRLLIFGESNHIKGKIASASVIAEAKYFVLKGNTVAAEHPLPLDAENRFDFNVEVDLDITSIRIETSNADDFDLQTWDVSVTSRLKHLDYLTISSEGSYPATQYSVFCAYKEPYLFHADDLCSNPDSVMYWWDLSCYQSGTGAVPGITGNVGIINLASPAAYQAGGNHVRVITNSFRNTAACRTAANNNTFSVRQYNYTMISTARPELVSVFDRVETEKDLWDLLDTYVPEQGKTIMAIYNPLTTNIRTAAVADGEVHWIAWGPTNGTGAGGDKGLAADNRALGLIRIKSVERGTTKQVTFEIKFPGLPNYRQIYRDSYWDRPQP